MDALCSVEVLKQKLYHFVLEAISTWIMCPVIQGDKYFILTKLLSSIRGSKYHGTNNEHLEWACNKTEAHTME